MENVAFIINPYSSKGNYQQLVKEIEKEISQPNIYISKSIEGTNEFIKNNFDKVDIFTAIGGDGTISSVAAQLIGTDKILAIYPAGSGNGFSNETGFSKDIKKLLEKIKRKNPLLIDTFTVNDQLSINVSGVGFDGEVTKEFEKTSRGFLNYIKVSIKTFFKYQPIELQFTHPEFEAYNGAYLMVNFANTKQFGNNAYIAPNAEFTDGLIEVVLVKKFPLFYGGWFAWRMFKKTLKSDQYVTYLSVPEIDFKTNTQNWHLDGEYRQIQSPVKVKINPQSLYILK